jgi:protein-S-isoprenylcysteine O-methyltransferase Ste14
MLKFATTPEAGPACDTTSEYRRVTSADFRAFRYHARKMKTLELKIPPLALALAFALVMWLASTRIPELTFVVPGQQVVAMLLAGLGAGMVLLAAVKFRRAGTTMNPTRPQAARTVVAAGIYRLSRNPMYVGVLFILAGWAVFLSHALPFLFLPGFVIYMNRFQIVPEERMLAAKFGYDYERYRRTVRRWL